MKAETRSDLEGMFVVAQDHWKQHGVCLQICLHAHLYSYERRYNSDTGGDVERIKNVFRALGFRGPGEAYRWNDADGRTKDEVLHRIKDALNNNEQEQLNDH